MGERDVGGRDGWSNGMGATVRELEAVYESAGPGLLRYLQRMVGSREAAEDLLQETFLRALGGVEKLKAADSPRAWLFAIARNVGRNALRGRRRWAVLPEDLAGPTAAEEDPRLARMREAIAGLPAKQREAMELGSSD